MTQKPDYTPELLAFGQHIAKLRKNATPPLSQEDLSGLTELDRTYISGIENGKRNLSLINLYKIAKALGLPPKDLLDYPEAGIIPDRFKPKYPNFL